MIDSPFFLEVKSPISAAQLRPLDQRCRRVQFCTALTDKDFEKLANFLEAYPHVELRVYGDYRRIANLRFLKHFPFIRRLSIETFNLSAFDGIEYVSDELESLTIGQTKSKKHSLQFLTRFSKLRNLEIGSHTKNIDVVSSLKSLENLTLRSITLPDLSLLLPLKSLLSLSIKLGGTNCIDLLPKIGKLRFIKLWMVRGLEDLTPIANVSTVQFLYLHALKNVTTLPSLRKLRKLRRVNLIGMKGLTELSSIANAPNLEELVAFEMSHLAPQGFLPFVGHKRLKHALIDIGNAKKSEEALKLLDLSGCDLIGDDFVFETSKSR
jgi:hypothetical protein